jgi:hypothetical protein
MIRALVLADTHIRPGRARRLPDAVYAELERSDVVLHAGDVLTGDLLDELGGFAPVHAVLGNNDVDLVGVLPETIELDLGGVRVAMVHEIGPTKGREARVHRRFPGTAISPSMRRASGDSGCSIRDRRPSGAGHPLTPTGVSGSRTARWWGTRSLRFLLKWSRTSADEGKAIGAASGRE